MAILLGPCPHCGAEGHWYDAEQKYDVDFEGDHQLWTYIECPRCHARTPAHDDYGAAEADWNSGKVMPAMIEAPDRPSADPAPKVPPLPAR